MSNQKGKRARIASGMIGALYLAGVFLVVAGWGQAASADDPASWKAPGSAASRQNPVPSDQASIAQGKATFDQNCAVCHGTNGKGDGPAAFSLSPRPADLAGAAVQKQTDGELHWKIRTGHGSMPAFGPKLGSRMIWELVNFIRSLGR